MDPSDDELKILDKHGHQLPPELRDIQNSHKEYLFEKTKKLIENSPLEGKISARCLDLITYSAHYSSRCFENELLETVVKHEKKLDKSIFPNEFFHRSWRSRPVPHMVLVVGVPGIGKTFMMQKFVYDWVKGDLYQRFSFVFFFTFRELNRLEKVSLESMILHHYPYLEEKLGNILEEPEQILFIFDGLDESNHTIDFASHDLCPDPKQTGPCGQIVVSLVRKSLLNGCSVLITSRPIRLRYIDCDVFQRMVEIIGFSKYEQQIYFRHIFSKLADKVFNYVKQNTFSMFCYFPSYCWIICTVLSKINQKTSIDQEVSSLPKTVTQLFAIFVNSILSNQILDKSDTQKLLRSMGWMAEYGVMNRTIIFDDRDLESFHVDNKSKLLSSSLIESNKDVTYSFLHLAVQEFFSALVHYVDYSPEKLQNSLKRATSFHDGRGEMFLCFLCGLSDASTRSILTGYLDTQADQASKDVMTWLKNLVNKEQLMGSIKERQHLRKTFFYFVEAQNKTLVRESLQSVKKIDFSGVSMSSVDCTVLAFIMESCTHIEELNLSLCSLDPEKIGTLVPVMHNLQKLSLAQNYMESTSCIQLASVIRNNPSLRILDLTCNRLYGPHLSDLMESLSSPACKIEELHLAVNIIPDTSCIYLASGIRNNPSLKILNLSYNQLFGPHLRDLMEALSSPGCRIEELYVAKNKLQDTSYIELASVMKNNRSQKILELSYKCLCGPNLSDSMEAQSSADSKIEELQDFIFLLDLLMDRITPRDGADPSSFSYDRVDFIDRHQSDLIQWIAYIDLVVSQFYDKDLVNVNQFNNVMKKRTSKEKMIELCDIIRHWEEAKKIMGFTVIQSYNEMSIEDRKVEEQKSVDPPPSISGEVTERHHSADNRWITNIDQVLLNLRDQDLLTPKEYTDVMEMRTSQEKVGKLRNVTRHWEFIRMYKAYKVIQKYNEDLTTTDRPPIIRETSQEPAEPQASCHKMDFSCEFCGQEQDQDQVLAEVVSERIGSRYRLEVKSPGLYHCRKTGIKFQVKAPVIIEYNLEAWSDHLNHFQGNYEILGPLFNIQTHGEPNAVSAVYLPHFLCLKGFRGDTSQIKCAHFKDGNLTLETPTRIDPFYITVEAPTFSLLGALFGFGKKTIPIHGIVLIYFTVLCKGDPEEEHRIHLYVLPHTTNAEEDLDRTNKHHKYLRIVKPEHTRNTVYTNMDYLVSGHPEVSVCPETLKFQSERYQYTEIQLKKTDAEIFLSVSEEVTKDPVWTTHLRQSDMKNTIQSLLQLIQHEGSCASLPGQRLHFLDEHRADLIQMISVVDPVLDDLLGPHLLTSEQYQTVRSQNINHEKMRWLYDYIKSWGNEDKDKVLQSLRKHNRSIINHLERGLV
ncbi:NACHT, LRR and PYD domains-containing protein 1b allele 2-like isoform X1 [Engystomops pustulosus]|uniref:NACHT, LRR and PYD domains-containing protein 1b allele 2-like isoform X1 n=1 Tax=Engystomops pustulosus TaxID=76066 RepID=UPI003AFAEA7D